MSASSLNAQPIMHDQQQKSLQVAALLQQSRMAQIPPSFAARNTGLSSGNAAFSLPTPGPNQGLMQPRHQTYQQPIGPRPVGNVYSHQQPGSMSKFRQWSAYISPYLECSTQFVHLKYSHKYQEHSTNQLGLWENFYERNAWLCCWVEFWTFDNIVHITAAWPVSPALSILLILYGGFQRH
jgi:hypothetical protein